MIVYSDLILFRNELKNRTIPKYKIIGIISQLLLSRSIFLSNIDIREFLIDTLGVEFKPYLFKSRTLLVARVTREILTSDNDNYHKDKLYNFIETQIEILKNKNETKNERNEFDGWL